MLNCLSAIQAFAPSVVQTCRQLTSPLPVAHHSVRYPTLLFLHHQAFVPGAGDHSDLDTRVQREAYLTAAVARGAPYIVQQLGAGYAEDVSPLSAIAVCRC